MAQLFEVPISLGIALRRRALTETGDEALETLQEAIRGLEEIGAELEPPARGRVLRRAGQRVSARSHLLTGLDLVRRGGATGLEAELREELMAGARPRRPAVTGIDSLTPRDLRVARLAAQGLSDGDIAELIFVSRNTIAWRPVDVVDQDRHWMMLGEVYGQPVKPWMTPNSSEACPCPNTGSARAAGPETVWRASLHRRERRSRRRAVDDAERVVARKFAAARPQCAHAERLGGAGALVEQARLAYAAGSLNHTRLSMAVAGRRQQRRKLFQLGLRVLGVRADPFRQS